MEFDKDNSESVFLNFVTNEFFKRGTEYRKLLSDKSLAPIIVSSWGLTSAQRCFRINSLQELTHEHLGDRCAFKYGRGWSAKGVFLLERLADDQYLDHKSLRVFSLAELIQAQESVRKYYDHQEPYWLVEELHRGVPANAEIPYDYKFYTFQGVIGFIISVDRNASPPRIAIFDGNLMPFLVDKDYQCPSPSVQQGNHVIPRSIIEQLWWARELSQQTDSPFVRVDLYDTQKGPAFGEFTFSPGDMHKRMFKLNRPFLDQMDHLFTDAESRLAARIKEPPREIDNYPLQKMIWNLTLDEVRALAMIDERVFTRYVDVVINNGLTGYDRMAKKCFVHKKSAQSELEAKVFEELRKAWRQLHEAYHPVKNEAGA